jgi:hypothetical protein
MKIQKTQTVAYEAAKDYGANPNSLLMLGTESLYATFPELERSHLCSEHNSFISIYDLDHSFYYRIDRLEGQDSVANEVGIGNLIEHSGNIVLVRSQPMYVTPKDEERMCCYGSKPLDFSNLDDILMVTSYIPTNIVEALPDPNMIITSLDDHFPHPLKIEKQSVIGRLTDTIESIAIADLAKLVSGGSLVAPPLTPETKPELGTIVFDPDAVCLCYWNGKNWIQLMEMEP